MNFSTMNSRERAMAALAAGLLVLIGGQWMFAKVMSPIRLAEADVEKAEKLLLENQGKLTRAELDARQVKMWEEAALPWEPTEAVSVYRDWLSVLIEKAKLRDVVLQPDRSQTVSRTTSDRKVVPVYRLVSFTIQANGDLKQLTNWLYDFYDKDLLQRVKHLTIQPLKDPKELKLTMVVEALALPNAPSGSLTERASSQRLALSTRDAYEKLIVSRNVFVPYTPPPPVRPPYKAPEVKAPPRIPTPPPPPRFDDSKFAFLTAILNEGDEAEVWVLVRTTGKLHKLHHGDSVEVGQFKGTITRIGKYDIEITTGGQRLLIALGNSLRDSAPLPPGEI